MVVTMHDHKTKTTKTNTYPTNHRQVQISPKLNAFNERSRRLWAAAEAMANTLIL